jgi:preflagellin peptidase FlaK
MIELLNVLNLIRLFTGVSILFYASYTDIKTRRASNILWLIMGSIGGILLLIQYLTINFVNIYYLIFIPVMIGLIYLLFQLRLIFGGADAKALMAIAILVPIEPLINQFPIWSGTLMPFSWSIFANSIIIFLFIPLFLLIYNLIKGNRKLPHAFLGYMMEVKKAKKKFVWPLEKYVDGKRKFVYMPKDFDASKEYKEFENHGIINIWVTPKIPFMIPLLIGFIFAFIFGDILFYFMNSFS